MGDRLLSQEANKDYLAIMRPLIIPLRRSADPGNPFEFYVRTDELPGSLVHAEFICAAAALYFLFFPEFRGNDDEFTVREYQNDIVFSLREASLCSAEKKRKVQLWVATTQTLLVTPGLFASVFEGA